MKKLTIIALVLWGTTTARAEEPRACTAVLAAIESRGVPQPLLELAAGKLRERLGAQGCTLVESKAVASMRAMLKVPRRPARADWLRLGKSLLADPVVTIKLENVSGGLRVELTAYGVAVGAESARVKEVNAAELLPTVLALADELLPLPAASSPESDPASAPASQPAPAPIAPPPPVVAPRPSPPPAPPVVQPAPAAQPAQPVASPAPPAVKPAPAPAAVKRRDSNARLFLGTGIRLFHLFASDRTGPALEVELGALREFWRGTALFRSYFGDRTSYYFGGRLEGGPRIGPLRLSFGGDLGFVFTPDVGDAIDLLTINLHLAGALMRFGHLVVQLDAFSLDVNVRPANTSLHREVETFLGFSSGLHVGAAF